MVPRNSTILSVVLGWGFQSLFWQEEGKYERLFHFINSVLCEGVTVDPLRTAVSFWGLTITRDHVK